MEIFTLILATILTILLYWWRQRWHQNLLCAQAPNSDTSDLSPATRDLADQRHPALPEKGETVRQPEAKLTTLRGSLRFIEEEDHKSGDLMKNLSPYDTVAEAKRKLGIEGRHLVFAGKPLDDAKTLEACGVKDGAKLYATPPETVAFQVRSITGRTLALRCDVQDKVATLRLKVETVLGIEGRHLVLVLRDKELDRSMTLKESGLQDGDVVHLVIRFRGGETVGRITAQNCPEFCCQESWGDTVVEQAMRATAPVNQMYRGEDSNVEETVHSERNIIEGFRFQMAHSTVVVVVFVYRFEEPYLLELEKSWNTDQAKDLLQRALGISVSQELRFYFRAKEISDFNGLRDGDFVELW